MMSTVHNPVNFDPAAYEVIAYLDNRPFSHPGDRPLKEEIEAWRKEMSWALGADWHSKAYHCCHCGNSNVRWITAVLHRPTGDRVVFGSDCTHRLGFEDRKQFQLAQLQARAEARKVRVAAFLAREAYVAANPLIAQALLDIDKPEHSRNTFAKDVLAKLGQYGSLTERQRDAVIASMARDRQFAANRSAEAAEVKGPAPSGRQTVSGVVLSVKNVESDFGVTTKMLVKLENNSRVWVTVPSACTVDRGDRVTFAATFEPKAEDPSFAFGKRPTLHKHEPAGQAAAVTA